MMRGNRVSIRISIKSIVLIISTCLISAASATLISGSENTAYLSASYSGSTINIQVDYALYDGTSENDPLGITPGDYQIGFVLEHIGAETGHESDPIMDMKRFVVYDPSTNFYTGYGYDLDSAGEAPHAPAGYGDIGRAADHVSYNFVADDYSSPDFVYDELSGTGDISKILAVSMPAENLPETIWLEIDELDPAGHAEIEIDIVPEPTSMALFGLGLSLFTLIRKK